jgi:hypothetical protein
MGAPAPGTAEFVAYESMIEYTKVITGQTTGAAPTDSAMKETAKQLSITGDSPAQIADKFNLMDRLMTQKEKAQNDGYQEMKANVAQGVKIGSTPPAPAAATGGSSSSDLIKKYGF